MSANPALGVHGPHLPSEGRVRGCGLTLAYREWNPSSDGLPIVLLHGITGSSADWQRTALHLAGRRLLAFDARGHGDSDWAADEAYGGDQHFADLALALDALGVDHCLLAGFSMGGGVATIAAAAMPERVAGAVVIDAYPHAEMTPGSRRIAGWVSRYREGGAWFDPAIARHFFEQLAEGRDARLDLWSLWEAITCPVLLVRGESSDVLTAQAAAEMLARLPHARLETISGVAHQIPSARPREVADVLAAFADTFDAR